MDRSNYERLLSLAPDIYEPNIRLFMKYAPEMGTCEIPDPFFGGAEGFDYVLNLIEVASRGLLASLMKEGATPPYARRADQRESAPRQRMARRRAVTRRHQHEFLHRKRLGLNAPHGGEVVRHRPRLRAAQPRQSDVGREIARLRR